MALSPGTRVGSYEIRSALGSGGMGEVYRARDSKLERDVALKVLPAEFARDPDRTSRFIREAQVLAALNHPNIGGEMLTGRRLFEGEDVTETIAAVVKEQPDWTQVPAQVQRLLKSCLEKDPKKRLQAIGDMRFLLEDAAPLVACPSRLWLGKAAWALTGAAALSAGVLAFIHFRETPPETPVVRSTILPPENTTLDFTNGIGLLSLSPDGRRIVFGARTADGKTPLWVRSLDGFPAHAERLLRPYAHRT